MFFAWTCMAWYWQLRGTPLEAQGGEMNFEFAPGVTPQDQRVCTPHCHRARTPAISGKRRLSAKWFLDQLPASTTATRSIDTYLFGSYANCNGRIFVLMSALQGADTKSKTPDEAAATASHPPIVAEPVFDPAPDDLWFERLGCAPLADLSVDCSRAHRAKMEGLQA
jgi:hypothetical protein